MIHHSFNVLSPPSWVNILRDLFYNNTLTDWLFALVAFALAYYIGLGVKLIISQQLRHRHRIGSWRIFRYIQVLVESTNRLFYLAWGLYAGCFMLNLSEPVAHILFIIPFSLLLAQTGQWGNRLLNYKLASMVDAKITIEERQQFNAFVIPLRFIGLSILWTILCLIFLNHAGVNVSALLAGLGIGGIAVALAVQSTLSDLLAALTIAFDKPFIVGDFIITDDYMGTVEKIGLKTTRLRSLSGEELVFPNNDLLKARIRNYKRMQERRIVFSFSIKQDTPIEIVEKIPGLVKELIVAQETVRFDRVHFAKLSPGAYDFEVVYIVLNADYAIFMDKQQSINLALLKLLHRLGVELANPTHTIYLQSIDNTAK